MISSLAELEESVRGSCNSANIPAIGLGISRGTKTLLSVICGLADLERGLPATEDTPFALASVTKPMTATALMMLAKEHLDRPVNYFLAGSTLTAKAGSATQATLRRVADHSSGLHTYFRFYYADEGFERAPFDEVVERYGILFTQPGERYHYSNLGYGLLDHVIEKLSGQSYDAYMEAELFEPLGMHNSFIGPPSDRSHAVSYGPDGVAYPQYDFDHPGGSAAYSSLTDLLRFGQFHLGHGPALLSVSDIESMHTASSSVDATRGYGLGWGTNLDRLGLSVVQHTGSMGGVSSILRLVPELDLTIAVVANGQTDLPSRLADEALASLLPDFRLKLIEERMQTQAPDMMPIAEELHGSWQGCVNTYEGDRELELHVMDASTAIVRLCNGEHVVESPHMLQSRLVGVFDGSVWTDDAARRPYRLHLDLKREGNGLQGALLAMTNILNGGGGSPENRYGNALPYRVELKKKVPLV
ncbi:MAG: serine hydrolase domain-containing protein [Fimbriimonas sp.]